jgi:hypothetical protein
MLAIVMIVMIDVKWLETWVYFWIFWGKAFEIG